MKYLSILIAYIIALCEEIEMFSVRMRIIECSSNLTSDQIFQYFTSY